MLTYTLYDFVNFLFLYSFLGWCAEVIVSSIRSGHFINKGFLNLPVTLPYGISALLLMQTLHTLQHHLFLQAVFSFVVFHVVWSIAEVFVQNICHLKETDTSNLPTLTLQSQLFFELCASMILLAILLIVHPFVYSLMRTIPTFIKVILSFVLTLIFIIDFSLVIFSLKKKSHSDYITTSQKKTQNIADKLNQFIWNRLKKAYPQRSYDQHGLKHPIFAKDLGFDKLVWIFLTSSFLGAIIEMCFCRITDGFWMNRSSLLYGAFSIVWGAGAVVLTISLKPLSNKRNLFLFLSAFLIGGVYEYMCSVFTEKVFGTVFWDYSHMALNIGGRTNILYCVFWGLLGVVWIRLLMPPLEKCIEKIPPLYGKVVTWLIVILFILDSLLTSFAMIRYTNRQQHSQPNNVIEEFIDFYYDDDWMIQRWPNMTTIE